MIGALPWRQRREALRGRSMEAVEPAMLGYALTIFTSSFLLFQVQPLIGKYILPWFGGSPSVWTTCLLFFQVLLLGGYAFAHVSVRILTPRRQAIAYGLALAAAVLALPVDPAGGWQPDGVSPPTLSILMLLVGSVGLPYFVLASTSPLMQAWFTRVHPGTSPYRWYALSNAGSLLALLSYPFVVEPMLSRQNQVTIWSVAFVGYALLGGVCALRSWRQAAGADKIAEVRSVTGGTPEAAGGTADDKAGRSTCAAWGPSASYLVAWILLPAIGSLMLLAVTNQLSMDIGPTPFLWVLPLAIYLLTFVVVFDHERWYRRGIFGVALSGLVGAVVWILGVGVAATFSLEVAVYLLTLFICCMICHGELAACKPAPSHLTSYYMSIAAGGALGSLFVAVVAPTIFPSYLELHVGLLLSCVVYLVGVWTSSRSILRGGRPRWAWGAIAMLAVGLGAGLAWRVAEELGDAGTTSRNFYGVLRVIEEDPGTPAHTVKLQHGRIVHGLQFSAAGRRRWPTSYYGGASGAGLALRLSQRQGERRIGLVGLGVGTLASYARTGEYLRIYEINPAVRRLAEETFTFLEDSSAEVDLIMGDARLSMEREEPQNFDVLLLDAFNSDAIPVHLLTKEAFEIYLRHLRPDGVLGIHISNRHIDLEPAIERLAEHFDLQTVYISNDDDEYRAVFAADWMLLTNNHAILDHEEILAATEEWNDPSLPPVRRVALWTDDFTNVLQLVRW